MMSLRRCEPSSIIKSNPLKPFILNISSRIDLTFSSFLTSTPNTSMFFDTYLKFDIFISKQKISEFGKYFTKAAADAPAYEPISKTFISFFLKFCNCSS